MVVDLDSENEYKAFLPYFAHVVGGNNKEYYDSSITTCTQLMNKYQHYLFGLYMRRRGKIFSLWYSWDLYLRRTSIQGKWI